MARSIVITKRAGGGFTTVRDSGTPHLFSRAEYDSYANGLILIGIMGAFFNDPYMCDEWTVGAETGFTTIEQVADAIDALGVTGQSMSISRIISNEAAKVAEFDGVNKIFTTDYKFVLRSMKVYDGTTRMPLDVAYTEAADGLSITFLGDAPDPVTSTLFWDYIKA